MGTVPSKDDSRSDSNRDLRNRRIKSARTLSLGSSGGPHQSSLKRSRTGVRLSIKVTQLLEAFNPKAIPAPRRSGIKGVAVPTKFSTVNPKFKPKSKGRVTQRTIASQRSDIFLELGGPSNYDAEAGRYTPRPPVEEKIRARFAIAAQLSFDLFEQSSDPKDYRSSKFSALSLSTEELKEAAVNMILCTITPELLKFGKMRVEKTLRSSKDPKRATGVISSFLSLRSTGGSGRLSRATTMSMTRASGKYAVSYPLEPSDMISDDVREAVVEFVDSVEKNYTNTHYHGFKHAIDVTQMMFMMCYFLRSRLSAIHPFVLITTCLCHDVGHFGANNMWIKKNPSAFRDKFPGDSPMEQFHVMTYKRLVKESRLFSDEFMTPERRRYIVTTTEELILGTDMDRHADYMNKCKEDLENDLAQSSCSDGSKESTLLPLSWMILALKLCDVANVTRDFEDAKKWSFLLSQEFNATNLMSKPEHAETTKPIADENHKICDGESIDSLLEKNVAFPVAPGFTSKCLLDFQEVSPDPNFEACSDLTSSFILQCVWPMVTMLCEVQPDFTFFLYERIKSNLDDWKNLLREMFPRDENDDKQIENL